jgi:hypothetical protein
MRRAEVWKRVSFCIVSAAQWNCEGEAARRFAKKLLWLDIFHQIEISCVQLGRPSMVTQTEHDLATERAREIRESGRYIIAAGFDPVTQTMHVTFKSGFTISFPKERSQVTAYANDADLADVEISPAGWSVDFPKLDDGLTAEGLLAGRFGTANWEHEWAECHREKRAA